MPPSPRVKGNSVPGCSSAPAIAKRLLALGEHGLARMAIEVRPGLAVVLDARAKIRCGRDGGVAHDAVHIALLGDMGTLMAHHLKQPRVISQYRMFFIS